MFILYSTLIPSIWPSQILYRALPELDFAPPIVTPLCIGHRRSFHLLWLITRQILKYEYLLVDKGACSDTFSD